MDKVIQQVTEGHAQTVIDNKVIHEVVEDPMP
jgi:hypothetical protein